MVTLERAVLQGLTTILRSLPSFTMVPYQALPGTATALMQVHDLVPALMFLPALVQTLTTSNFTTEINMVRS